MVYDRVSVYTILDDDPRATHVRARNSALALEQPGTDFCPYLRFIFFSYFFEGMALIRSQTQQWDRKEIVWLGRHRPVEFVKRMAASILDHHTLHPIYFRRKHSVPCAGDRSLRARVLYPLSKLRISLQHARDFAGLLFLGFR